MKELKPCPFCGGIPMLEKKRKHKKFPYRVVCTNLYCTNRTNLWNTAEGAVNAWNRRTNNG